MEKKFIRIAPVQVSEDIRVGVGVGSDTLIYISDKELGGDCVLLRVEEAEGVYAALGRALGKETT